MNESSNRASLPTANVEQIVGNASFRAKEMPRFDSPVNIKVTSYRKRNTDPDGISAKAVLDGLVRAGILADDSAKEVKSFTSEVIIAKEEKTVIELEEV
jgi:Holliday junction resolvase RusA-like endonuclease